MQKINQITDWINSFFLENLPDLILNPKFTGTLLTIKVIFIVISFILSAMIIWLLMVSTWFRRAYQDDITEFKNYRPFELKDNLKAWKKIVRRLASNKEVEHKLAVIEAYGFFDEILKSIGYTGKTLDERLKQLNEEVLANLNDVKWAIGIRANIVKDRHYKLTPNEATKALVVFEEALKNLGAL